MAELPNQSQRNLISNHHCPSSAEPTPYENKQLSARAIQRLCPSVDLRNSGQRLKSLGDVYDDVLLIVTFNRAEYHNIPLFEVIYRHHFKNMLYCGEPDPVVDEYMSQYLGLQGSHFSFLPARSKTGYECLLGAIEMGYEVEGCVGRNEILNFPPLLRIMFRATQHLDSYILLTSN